MEQVSLEVKKVTLAIGFASRRSSVLCCEKTCARMTTIASVSKGARAGRKIVNVVDGVVTLAEVVGHRRLYEEQPSH